MVGRMGGVRKYLTFANVTAVLALFIALGGPSYAAKQMSKNSVGTKQLRKNAGTSPKVKDHTLQASDFKAGTLLIGPAGPAGPQGPAGPSSANTVVPAAALTSSVNVSLANNNVVAVPFNVEEFDTADMHAAGQPSRLTAPKAGIYQVSASIAFSINGTGVRSLSLYVNGTNVNPAGESQAAAPAARKLMTSI